MNDELGTMWDEPKLTSFDVLSKHLFFFYVLPTVHLSIFIVVVNQLDAQNLFYNKFISSLYMFRAHVLIVRRSELYYTASGIITLKQVSGLKLLK